MSTPSTGRVDQNPLHIPFSRRTFLTGAAAASLTALMVQKTGAIDDLLHDLDPAAAAATTSVDNNSTTFTFSVARDADLALLDFTFYNFEAVKKHRSTAISALKATSNASVITVRLPPQAIGEAAYQYPSPAGEVHSGDWAVDPPPVVSGLSGPSLLCFTIGQGELVQFSSPMAASDLLDWSQWTLLVPSAADGPVKTSLAPTDPRESASPVTYIEYPYAVLLSPAVSNDDAYSTQFIGRTPPDPLLSPTNVGDLWTTALQQIQQTDDTLLTAEMAAVWATDYNSSTSATGPNAGSSNEYIVYRA